MLKYCEPSVGMFSVDTWYPVLVLGQAEDSDLKSEGVIVKKNCEGEDPINMYPGDGYTLCATLLSFPGIDESEEMFT